MKKKFLFIINPTAGNGQCARSVPKIKEAIDNLSAKSPEIKGEIITTEYKNHATELVRAYQNNYEVIIIVGGDGTLNEAINGLDPASETIMGVIPEGSGNDFAKMMGMKQDIDSNIDIIVNHGQIKRVDIGEIEFLENGGTSRPQARKFINSAGIGFDALVSDLKNRSRNFQGFSQYIWSIFQALKKYSFLDINAAFDKVTNEVKKSLLIAISNGKTYGGGIKVNPNAEIDDGLLDACIIYPITIPRVLWHLRKFIKGTHGSLDIVKLIRFKEAEIKTEQMAFIHADGEVISDKATHIKFVVKPKAFKILFNKSSL